MSLVKEFKFLFNELPFSVILYPTSRCNATCGHCYNYDRELATSKDQELSLEEIEKISRNLDHVKVLSISGGEPFIRKDLEEIVSVFHKNNGLQYLTLHTNASMPGRVIDGVNKLLASCKDLKITVCVSIDGLEDLHDKIRGIKDGFKKIVETVQRLREIEKTSPNLNTVAASIYSKSTQDNFMETMDYIDKEVGVKSGLAFIRGKVHDENEKAIELAPYLNFYKNSKMKGRSAFPPFSGSAVKEILEDMTHKIVEKNHLYNRQSVPCQAGNKLIVIYENGDVYPCEVGSPMFGNLRDVDYDPKKILFSEKGEHIRTQICKEQVCSCTWENVIPINILFSPKYYPRIICDWVGYCLSSIRRFLERKS